MPLNIFPVPKFNCPHCGKPMNRLGTADPDTKPVPGAIVFCAECNGLSMLNDDVKSLRKITDEEMTILSLDDDALSELAQFARWAEYKRRMERSQKN